MLIPRCVSIAPPALSPANEVSVAEVPCRKPFLKLPTTGDFRAEVVYRSRCPDILATDKSLYIFIADLHHEL